MRRQGGGVSLNRGGGVMTKHTDLSKPVASNSVGRYIVKLFTRGAVPRGPVQGTRENHSITNQDGEAEEGDE